IKGPPGTGKSQTITNIIATAAAQGRTVLFVAEKMAALDVVHRRLRDVGLASMALELHSSKANKRALLEELKRTRDMGAPAPAADATLIRRLTECRDNLNSHAEMMHTPHEPSGLTPFKLLGGLIRSGGNSRASEYSLDAPQTWSPRDLETRRELIEEIAERIVSDDPPHQHPWRGVDREALDPSETRSLHNKLDALSTDLMTMAVCAEHASALFGMATPNTFGEAMRLLALAETAAGMPACDRRAFCNPVWACAEDITEIVERGERFSRLRAAFDSAFVESAWADSFDACRATLAEKG